MYMRASLLLLAVVASLKEVGVVTDFFCGRSAPTPLASYQTAFSFPCGCTTAVLDVQEIDQLFDQALDSGP